MNEVEKMYENAEVKKQIPKVCSSNELYCKECEAHIEDAMPYCKNAEYPPFTAEKQLNIIKWLLKNYDIGFSQLGERIDTSLYGVNESLAQAINDLWQDLTEEEHTQIKEILE